MNYLGFQTPPEDDRDHREDQTEPDTCKPVPSLEHVLSELNRSLIGEKKSLNYYLKKDYETHGDCYADIVFHEGNIAELELRIKQADQSLRIWSERITDDHINRIHQKAFVLMQNDECLVANELTTYASWLNHERQFLCFGAGHRCKGTLEWLLRSSIDDIIEAARLEVDPTIAPDPLIHPEASKRYTERWLEAAGVVR